MIYAKNNIIVKLNGAGYAILNPLSGSFDIMTEAEHESFLKIKDGAAPDPELAAYLLERGYLYHNEEEYRQAYADAYKEFRRDSADSQTQLMLIPTYGCNLACTYCFQHGIDGAPALIQKETVDAFFDHIRKEYRDAAVKPYITLFGGEPLVNSPAQREIISYIVDKCALEDYELAMVTNGYDFADFVPILKKARIKEVQFTLDGDREVHDARRCTANKRGTFEQVVQGMEAAIDNGMPVNLRTVTDWENVDELVQLADYLDKKGWLDLPQHLFKTQIGRNYELFECYSKPEHLMTQVELWARVAELGKKYPVMAKFHKPDFKGIRYLVETGELPLPSFDTCPAGKSEMVFDLNGEIYGCTASCGRQEYKLGTFWPEVAVNENAIGCWQQRDVATIPACKDCAYDIVCGGGCGVVAANKNGGDILTPDCRPIQELYEIGINYYLDEILEMAKGDEEYAS